MKKLLILILFISVTNASAQLRDQVPQKYETLSILFQEVQQTSLRIYENTFIPNIQGYACPWPAINLDKYHLMNQELNHKSFSDFGVIDVALKIHNPNRGFCSFFPTPEDIFGPDFKVGNDIKLKILTERKIIRFRPQSDQNGKLEIGVLETIRSEIYGVKLSSTAYLKLSK